MPDGHFLTATQAILAAALIIGASIIASRFRSRRERERRSGSVARQYDRWRYGSLPHVGQCASGEAVRGLQVEPHLLSVMTLATRSWSISRPVQNPWERTAGPSTVPVQG